MKWTNVKLILVREIRDQLRDRRTLFMITVLPLLLYPLLGMVFFQIVQFQRQHKTSVLVVGAGNLAGRDDVPPLLEGGQFAPRLFSSPAQAKRVEVHWIEDEPGETAGGGSWGDLRARARRAVLAGQYDVAICFPSDFGQRLERFRQEIHAGLAVPSPDILYSTASEKSQVAFVRVHEILQKWKEEIGRENLQAAGLPPEAASPFDLTTADVAEASGRRGAAFWSKVLPVLLLIWAMTGAFYPAVDLCAGEKERGTLETLLSSPAERSEIVLGKLATIMIFSMVTAVLNLASMGLTGWLVLARTGQYGAPPAGAVLWLAIALVPVSALFSALCLALAAFARSTKEGQYYLMPLLLVTMPLVILPMLPGVELNLGNSLIPVTGVVLLLRALLEGNFFQVVQFIGPVVAVTFACCVLAVRWAVDQFNSESVLFRESERLDMARWLHHLFEDRKPTPTVAAAVFCGVLILLIRFFMNFAMPDQPDAAGIVVSALVTQLVVIASPALLMTVLFTTSARQTLLLRLPGAKTVLAAIALAVLLHPTTHAVATWIERLYPMNEELAQSIQRAFQAIPGWQLFLTIALVPAVCEELAFRGFILSGFRHVGHKWRAIIYAAVFFGLAHAILQQSILATLIGVVLGLLAVQTGSIFPGMVFHAVHNGLFLASQMLLPRWGERWPALEQLYQWPLLVASAALALLLLAWFQRLPYQRSTEEERRETILRALPTDG